MREGQLSAIGLGPLLGVMDMSGDGLCELLLGDVARAFAFRDHRLVRYVTNAPSERLGRHAVGLGLVSDAQVDRALAVRSPGEPLGKALVRTRALDAAHVDWLVSLQAAEGILDAVTWKEGAYRITQTDVLDRPLDLLEGPLLQDLAADAGGRAMVWKDLMTRMPGLTDVLERTPAPAGAVDVADARLLALVGAGRSAAQAALDLNLPVFHVVLGLARLFNAGLVRPRALAGKTTPWPGSQRAQPGRDDSRVVRLRQLVAERDVGLAYAEARALLREDPNNADALAALRAVEAMSMNMATRESNLGEMLARLREAGVLPQPGHAPGAPAPPPNTEPFAAPPSTASVRSWDVPPTTAVATPAGLKKRQPAGGGFSPDAVVTWDRIPLVAVPKLTARASNLAGLGFTALECAQLTAVDGRRSVAELARHLHVDATALSDLILRAREAGAVTL